jgi:acetyl esterase/lipase
MEPLVEKKWDWLASLGPLLWQVTRSSFRKKIAPDWSGAYHSRKQRGVRPLIDVYLPKTDGPTPSVLMLHGGGFVSGDRRMSSMTLLAKTLNERGIAAASIDYRLLFRGGRLAEAVDDVRVAYDWWHAQADRFSLERGRVAVLGCSAGAALAVLASPDLKALWKLIAVYGVYNFGTLPGPKGLGLDCCLAHRIVSGGWQSRRLRSWVRMCLRCCSMAAQTVW